MQHEILLDRKRIQVVRIDGVQAIILNPKVQNPATPATGFRL